MDLTNIKPCVVCAKWRQCVSCLEPTQMAQVRISKNIVLGKDCFEEVKSNAEV